MKLASNQKRKYDDSNCSTGSGNDALSPQEVLSKRAKIAALEREYSQVGFTEDIPANHCFIMSQQEFDKLVKLWDGNFTQSALRAKKPAIPPFLTNSKIN